METATETEPRQNLEEIFASKGYTKNVIAFFKKEKVEDLSFKEMTTIIDSGGMEKLLKHEIFLKKIEFLKTIILEDFKKSIKVQEVREFLEKEWQTKKIFWDYIPVDIAYIEADQISILRDLAFVNKGKSEIISEKIYDLLLRKFYLKEEENAENVLAYFSMYLEVFTITKDVSLVNSSFIDLLLLKYPMIITELYKKGISISDSQLLRVLDSLKSNPEFLANDYGFDRSVSAFLNKLLGVFYSNQILIDFLIGYIKVTDRKNNKIEKFIKSLYGVLKENNKNIQKLKIFWLDLSFEMSNWIDFSSYRAYELLPKSPKPIVFEIVKNFFKEEWFYFSDESKTEKAMSLLNEKNKKKLKNFLITKLVKLDKNELFYVNQAFSMLEQDSRILDIGLDVLEKEQESSVYYVLDFLNLCKIHNEVVYQKAKKIIEGKQLKLFLEKEKVGKELREIVVQHFS